MAVGIALIVLSYFLAGGAVARLVVDFWDLGDWNDNHRSFIVIAWPAFLVIAGVVAAEYALHWLGGGR